MQVSNFGPGPADEYCYANMVYINDRMQGSESQGK